MSRPAEQLPVPVTAPRRAPSRTPAARPQPASPPQHRRRARRGPTSAFWIFSAVLVTAMVVGVASISALLVRSSFEVDRLGRSIAGLEREHEELTRTVAEVSSPSRVQAWAHRHGMVMPAEVVVLTVPGTGPQEAGG